MLSGEIALKNNHYHYYYSQGCPNTVLYSAKSTETMPINNSSSSFRIIIIMDIFKCYFSRTHIAIPLKNDVNTK